MDKIQATETLKAGVASLANSESFKAYLEMRAKMHNYSWHNSLMIAYQCPTATQVAGFNRWKDLGRFVRKGEKGIAIFAPLLYAKKDQDTGETTGMGIRGFRVVHVFDVAQTDGKPLPELPECETLTGTEGADIFECLQDFAKHGGIEVLPSFDAFDDERQGDYSCANKRIRIRSGLSALAQAHTMAHECSHWILHSSPAGQELARGVKETEAEASAYLVMARLGLKVEGASFPYIAGWAMGDQKVLEESLGRIEKAAEEILHAIESRMGELAVN